jgi:hypothetical protein
MDWALVFWLIAAWVGLGVYLDRQPDRMSDEWMERHKNDF